MQARTLLRSLSIPLRSLILLIEVARKLLTLTHVKVKSLYRVIKLGLLAIATLYLCVNPLWHQGDNYVVPFDAPFRLLVAHTESKQHKIHPV